MKRLLSVFVVIAIVLLTGQSIMAAEGEGFEENDTYLPKYESEAKLLHQYGLLTGTDKGFELDKPLTRLEGAVMVARLLGEEKAVQNGEYDHLEIPFTDVPEWGEGYVKYLYHNNIAAGTSKTTFGANDQMTAEQYMTFMLRILGYDDSQGDFEWRKSLDKGTDLEIIISPYILESELGFLRDHMVLVTYSTLHMKMKNNDVVLINTLIDEGKIDYEHSESNIAIEDRVITSGLYQERLTDSRVRTIILREKLPESMQNFVFFSVRGLPVGNYQMTEQLAEHYAELGVFPPGITEMVSNSLGDHMLLAVTLYDKDFVLVGYKFVNVTDIAYSQD